MCDLIAQILVSFVFKNTSETLYLFTKTPKEFFLYFP